MTLDPNSPAALLAERDDPKQASLWSLYNIDLCEDYQAALAVEGDPLQICYWEFVPKPLRLEGNRV